MLVFGLIGAGDWLCTRQWYACRVILSASTGAGLHRYLAGRFAGVGSHVTGCRCNGTAIAPKPRFLLARFVLPGGSGCVGGFLLRCVVLLHCRLRGFGLSVQPKRRHQRFLVEPERITASANERDNNQHDQCCREAGTPLARSVITGQRTAS